MSDSTAENVSVRAEPIRFRLPWGLVLGVATIGGLVVIWALASALGWASPVFLPSPARVWAALTRVATEGYANATLLEHMGASLWRVFAALFFTMLIGVPVGLLIATSRIGRGILDPLVEFIRPLPPLAYLPLIIIWFGIDETPKILLIFLSCFAPLALAARSGMRSAAQEQINAAYSMGASYFQVIRHVILPAALPDILVGMRIAIGFGWTTLVAAEMVAANVGLGQMVLNASNFLRTDIVIMGIIVIGVIAYVFDLFMRWVEKRLVPWKGRM